MVVVEATRAQSPGDAEPAKMLHGPAGDGIRLGVLRGRRLVVEQDTANAAQAELERQHQPDRPAAGDHNVGTERSAFCQRPGPASGCSNAVSPRSAGFSAMIT